MQQHPFKVGDTVYQYNPYKKIREKLEVISIDDNAGENFSKILISNEEGIQWSTNPELLSFKPYDFEKGGHTWSRSEILKQRLLELRRQYSDKEWREAIFDIPNKQEFTQIAEQMLKDLDELTSIQVGTITAEQLIKRSEDLRDALGHH